MTFRSKLLGKLTAGRSFTLNDVSVSLCASTVLAAVLLTQPLETVSTIVSIVTPAAHASEIAPRAAMTIAQDVPAWSERTVYFPEAFPPVAGEVATPIDQF